MHHAGASAEVQSADPLIGQDGLLLRMMIAAPVLSGATELNDFIASLPLQLNTIFTNEGGPFCTEGPLPTAVLESDATHVAQVAAQSSLHLLCFSLVPLLGLGLLWLPCAKQSIGCLAVSWTCGYRVLLKYHVSSV